MPTSAVYIHIVVLGLIYKNKVATWMKSLYFWFETSMAGDSQRMVRLLQNLTEHTHYQEAIFFAFKLEYLGTEKYSKI